jgi:biofilm protein TabA
MLWFSGAFHSNGIIRDERTINKGISMILDKIENWGLYPYGPAWERAFAFLSSLTKDMEEKEYPLQGRRMFARVMGYSTKKPEQGILESHRVYMDIQTVITGAEGMEWHPADGLTAKEPYNRETDAQFYLQPGLSRVRMNLLPGVFVALFPNDAHMAGMEIGNVPAQVRKVVVKVDLSLIESQKIDR